MCICVCVCVFAVAFYVLSRVEVTLFSFCFVSWSILFFLIIFFCIFKLNFLLKLLKIFKIFKWLWIYLKKNCLIGIFYYKIEIQYSSILDCLLFDLFFKLLITVFFLKNCEWLLEQTQVETIENKTKIRLYLKKKLDLFTGARGWCIFLYISFLSEVDVFGPVSLFEMVINGSWIKCVNEDMPSQNSIIPVWLFGYCPSFSWNHNVFTKICKSLQWKPVFFKLWRWLFFSLSPTRQLNTDWNYEKFEWVPILPVTCYCNRMRYLKHQSTISFTWMPSHTKGKALVVWFCVAITDF